MRLDYVVQLGSGPARAAAASCQCSLRARNTKRALRTAVWTLLPASHSRSVWDSRLWDERNGAAEGRLVPVADASGEEARTPTAGCDTKGHKNGWARRSKSDGGGVGVRREPSNHHPPAEPGRTAQRDEPPTSRPCSDREGSDGHGAAQRGEPEVAVFPRSPRPTRSATNSIAASGYRFALGVATTRRYVLGVKLVWGLMRSTMAAVGGSVLRRRVCEPALP